MENEFGPLIGELSDGTQIFRNAIINTVGIFEMNVGIFNFSGEFNPNTGSFDAEQLAACPSSYKMGI